jgi:hypothetical protein
MQFYLWERCMQANSMEETYSGVTDASAWGQGIRQQVRLAGHASRVLMIQACAETDRSGGFLPFF